MNGEFIPEGYHNYKAAESFGTFGIFGSFGTLGTFDFARRQVQ
jgi:hypothetical protein